MADKAAEVLVTQKLLEQILKAPGNLIALETTHVDDALVQFRTLAMRTGTSINSAISMLMIGSFISIP